MTRNTASVGVMTSTVKFITITQFNRFETPDKNPRFQAYPSAPEPTLTSLVSR